MKSRLSDSKTVTDLCQPFTATVKEIYQTVPLHNVKYSATIYILYILCVYLIYLHVNVLHSKRYFKRL